MLLPTRSTHVALALVACLGAPLAAQTSRHFALDSINGLRLQNVNVAAETFQGKAGVKVTEADPDGEEIAIVEGVEFGNGTIEAEIAGAPASGAPEGSRGFVGIAFRVQPDLRTYDCFY